MRNNIFEDHKELDLYLNTGKISMAEVEDFISSGNNNIKKFFAEYNNLPIYLLHKLCMDENTQVAKTAIKNISLQESDLIEIISDPDFKLKPEVILTNPNMKNKDIINNRVIDLKEDENDVRDNNGEYSEVGESLISQGSVQKKEKKYSLKEIKAMSPNALLKLINRAKKFLKKDKTWKDLCREYGQEVDIIDLIPTTFDKLPVSAKTNHGVVTINYKLLLDGDFFKDYSYLIHEYTHWFQQCFGERPTTSSDNESYLDNKFEQEGFQNQIKYITDHFGEKEADKYIDNLFEHHNINSKSKQDELESVFLEKVE